MSRTRTVVFASCAVYMAALAVAWVICTSQALRSTERLLALSVPIFTETIEGDVGSVLVHASDAIAERLGQTASPMSVEDTASIARLFQIDELNIVSRDGITIGSNVPKLIGANYHRNPQTAAFLMLTNPASGHFSQPFRNGVNNPEAYRKYCGRGFDDGSGFIQIGFDMDRLIAAIDQVDVPFLRSWTVGRSGHYDFAKAEYLPADFPDDKMMRGMENGRRIFFRAFTYAGHRYVSVLPESEYFGARNVSFLTLAPMLAIVVLLLLVFVRSLVRAGIAETRRREAEDAARARDLDLARDIQLSCLASPEPYRSDVMSLSFDVMTKPARVVGGDFYDFMFIDAEHVAFVMADVSGKGISAAMFMMMAKNEIFNALREMRSPADALTEANRRICAKNDAEMFVTAWVAVVDIVTGIVAHVNAGHNRPFVRHADGAVEKITARGGRFIGMFPDATYTSHRMELRPGDTLFLYTDGVTEAMNGAQEQYGEERLIRTLAASEAKAAAIVSAVESDVKSFVGETEPSDDFTELALVWHGAPECRKRDFPTTAESLGESMKWLGENITIPDRSARMRLLNAADEIIANVVSYSGAKTFTLRVDNVPDRTRIEVSDDGVEYNPLTHEAPDTHLPIEERPIGGLGIIIIRRLVDSVTYRRVAGHNVLTVLASVRH